MRKLATSRLVLPALAAALLMSAPSDAFAMSSARVTPRATALTTVGRGELVLQVTDGLQCGTFTIGKQELVVTGERTQ